MGTVLIIYFHTCFFFFFIFRSCQEACRILVPQPGIEPSHLLHWKCGVLTTGPLEIPKDLFFKKSLGKGRVD